MWVSPFGDLRVFGYVLLTVAFRSLSRPSSAPSARASTLRSFCLTALTFPSSVRASGFSMVLSIFLHNIIMLLRCLPIQRFILSNKSFLFGIRFLWCFSLSPLTQQALKELHLLYLLSFFYLQKYCPAATCFPGASRPSIIGLQSLYRRVRDGNGCFLLPHHHRTILS